MSFAMFGGCAVARLLAGRKTNTCSGVATGAR